jgi:hypothetical protein
MTMGIKHLEALLHIFDRGGQDLPIQAIDFFSCDASENRQSALNPLTMGMVGDLLY